MKEIQLRPIKETTEDYEEMERKIIKLFREEIYLPLLRELGAPPKTLKNTMEDLINAINTGQVKFYRGSFTGKFNSVISRELRKLGADWDAKSKAWKITARELPVDVNTAVALSESKFQKQFKKMEAKLEQLLPEEIAEKLKIEHLFDSSLYKIDQQFKKTVKGIVVAPDLTKEERKQIAEEYTKNMKLYIKDWSEKNIKDLRKQMKEHAFGGNRYEDMVKVIQRNYGVSQNKAKFLARQETSLLMTKFKESRYLDAGVDEYIWRTVAGSPNHPVRPYHKALEGKRFSWKNPPVVDKDGHQKNPGQDYNCRCYAVPVVKF